MRLNLVERDSLRPPAADPSDPAVQIWRTDDGEEWAYTHIVDGERWMHLPGLASFRLDGESGAATGVVDPAAPRAWIPEVYRRAVLPVALQAFGREALHASAVLTPHGVLALCAASGGGKSTTAYALSRLGHELWADDAVVFDVTDDALSAIPLPFRLRLRPRSAAFFGEDRLRAQDLGESVELESPHSRPAPMAGICLLERGAKPEGAPAELSRVPAAQAFTEVLVHASCFSLRDAERKQLMMRHYLELTARVPVFRARFSAGLDRLAEVAAAIDEASGQAAREAA